MWDCFSEAGVDLGCLIDTWSDGNGGSGGGGANGGDYNECVYPNDNTTCYMVCPKKGVCQACCLKVRNKCYSNVGIISTLEMILIIFEPYHSISYLFHGSVSRGVLELCNELYNKCNEDCSLAGSV